MAPWPYQVARQLTLFVGLSIAFGAALCGCRRPGGDRLAAGVAADVSAGLLSLLFGEVLWWAQGSREPVSAYSLTAYLIGPVFALGAMAALVKAGGGLGASGEGAVRPTPMVTSSTGWWPAQRS
jgi:hypothetical protein